MTMKPPPALNRVYTQIDPYLQYEKRGGIVGDAAHVRTGGYHISPELLLANGMGGDYSMVCPADKRGAKLNPQYASAIDITFTKPAEIKLVTRRLIDACTPDADGVYDPRIECVREVIGTLDGKNVCRYNRVATGSASRSRVGFVVTGGGDSSHTWHDHIGILRDRCNNDNDMTGLAEVICGLKPGALGWKGDAPVVVAPWTWDGKTFPGADRLQVGDEGAWVTWLGKRLVVHGWTGYSAGPGPTMSSVDLAGVAWAQKKLGLPQRAPDAALWALLAADPLPPKPTPKPTPAPSPDPKPTPAPDPKPTPEKPVKITIGGGNILRETDLLKGRKRWPARRANAVKALQATRGSVLLLCETDKSTAADIAAGLGEKWFYYPSSYGSGKEWSPCAILWDSSIWRRDVDAFVKEYPDNQNRLLQRLPLVHRETGKTVTFYVSHLENEGDPKTDGHTARKVEAKAWADWTLKGPGVFFADLNSTTPAGANKTAREREKPRPILKTDGGWSTFLSDQRKSIPNGQLASHHGGLGKTPTGDWIDDMGLKGLPFADGALVRTDQTDASDHHFLSITTTL